MFAGEHHLIKGETPRTEDKKEDKKQNLKQNKEREILTN